MRLMLTAYALDKTGPVPVALGTETTLPNDAVWVDLLSPSREEDSVAESALGISLPTFEEAKEIEFSSRFYEENGAIFMTASLLSGVEEGNPVLSPITFALTGNRIATIRYHDPRSFRQFIVRSMRSEGSCTDATGVLLGLLEAFIDRLADTVEKTGAEVDRLNHTIFMHGRRQRSGRRGERHLERVIEEIGVQGDFVAKTRESLASLQRLLQYADSVSKALEIGKQKGRIKLMVRDARSLTDQIDFLSGKIIFLLDGALGLVTVQQNEVIRILTVAAMFFFPPTLIGTIYGMNFEFMPELHWTLGYPLAIILMVLSALLPYLYFKRRGWL
jgi:magnesium transporter